jgi:membrane-bound serine protease (ClpP class)
VLLVLGLASACATQVDVDNAVHVITVDGTVDPVLERYIDRGIDEAEDTNAEAVVVRIDTPGGLVTSMEDIVKRINSSEVPVITYVWPSGGHAASAGTFIVMSGHVAAMAPGTRIGAASPVGAGGEDIEGTLGDKVEEDLAALLVGIAEERGRNAEWAEEAVRNAVSSNSDEALELGVVDFEARTLDDLLEQSEGRTVRVGEEAREVTLSVVDAPVVENDMTFVERLLSFLSDPNIAFLLLSLGGIGILLELLHPGVFFPGVFGAISLLLAFFALGTLPTNWAGVALILLAFALFAAEIYVAGFGALGIGGAIAFVLGGLILTTSDNADFQVNRWFIYVSAVVIAAFFLALGGAIIRTRRAPVRMGGETMIGKRAIVRAALDPDGYVFFEGARWRAHTEDAPVASGERVRITDVKGLKLTVERESVEPVTVDEASAEEDENV